MRGEAPNALVKAARDGSRGALARLLTYVETGGVNQRLTAALAYRAPAPFVIGVTGAPGAGKSTLTDRLITASKRIGDRGSALGQIAVLCVDPSSPFTGGAILGDRIRMQEHATDPAVYIRSMATRGHLGGLSVAVPDAVRVLGLCGFAVVIVETVGVGQMEVEIASEADVTVVVTNPGWGDEMQANKAGLLEVADLFVINKVDRPGVRETRRDLDQMLDLGAPRSWRPPIFETVATSDVGTDAVWRGINEYREHAASSGEAERRRRRRDAVVLERVLNLGLRARLSEGTSSSKFEAALDEIVSLKLDPYAAADQLIDSV